jgi:hypothetical protein
MSKLHSSTARVLFLSCGLVACADTESGADKPGISRVDASAVTETDASAKPRGGAPGDAASAADAESLREDAGASRSATPAAGPSDAPEGPVTEPAASAQPGTFSHIYAEAFRTCRTQCHVMGYAMLNMATQEAAYAALVNQDSNPMSKVCAELGLKRVKPGAPDESLLYLKLDNMHVPCGQQMPPGGQLKQEFRDEVRQWIELGALDN